jgi:hypothetical protein
MELKIEEFSYCIEEGFETDYSSIPWFGRFVVRWSRVDIAGVLHDWLYVRGILSRRESDKIWRITACSGEHRANALQGWICWVSLRLAGFIAWNRYRKVKCESQ